MARDRHRQRIRSARLSDGTHRFRGADDLCHICVARGRASRNISQRLPDALLEGSSTNIKRQIETKGWFLDEPDTLRNEPFKTSVTADEIGFRKLILQLAHKSVRVGPQKNGADATATLGYENGAQGALAHGKADVRLISACAIV